MTGIRTALGRVPAFLAGMSGAVALETSAGLLLYTDRGLLPALTLVLTVEVGALGLGLWSGHLSLGRGAVEQVRGRWLLALVAFSLAAACSMGLGLQQGAPGTGMSLGLGLAFLGSLPLFSVGSLLGAMARRDDLDIAPVSTVGVPSVVGAALGFLLAGALLLPSAAPHTIYLACLVALSGGALLQGWVLDGRPTVEVRERVWTSTGELRVDERILGSPRREIVTLTEDGRLRGAEGPEGRPGRGWEVAVLAGLESEGAPPGRTVYLGGGSGTLARLLLGAFPDTELRVVEGRPEVVDLARAHFMEWEGWGNLPLTIHEPMAFLARDFGPYSLVLMDSAALPHRGGAPVLSDADWQVLSASLAPGGKLILGGLRSVKGEAGVPLHAVMRTGSHWFQRVALYEGRPIHLGSHLLPGEGEGVEAFLVLFEAGANLWPTSLPGFRLREPREV
jgi:hypothetical protein